MSDVDLDDDVDELVEGLEKKKTSGKKIVIIIAVIAILGAAAAAFFLMGGEEQPVEEELADGEIPAAQTQSNGVFFSAEPMSFMVNLNTGGRQARYFSMNVSFQYENATDEAVVLEKLPLIRDIFNIYLRELREEDLLRSAGIFRLKEELLRRVNNVVAPVRVRDILFSEVLLQ